MLSLGKEQRAVLRHLLVCPTCRARLHYLPRERRAESNEVAGRVLPWPGSSGDYSAALDRSTKLVGSHAAVLDRERAQAPSLWVELLRVESEQRALLVENAPRFATWGLFELLVERSRETCIADPRGSEELARLAIRLSGRLDASLYQAEMIEDLRARAWGAVGNARRLRSDWWSAEEAFATAHQHLEKGTRDPDERAIFLDLKASLRRDQRQFDDAVRLLRRAIAIFRAEGERHRAGRSLVKLSTVLNYAGRTEETVPVLKEALGMIDAEQEPRLLLCAWHNLIDVHTDLGRFLEAQGLYRKARHLYRDFTDAWAQNRRQWVRGKIAHGLGQAKLAESLFLAARDGFLAEELPYDTALVSLELAILYLEQGRAAELRGVAEQIVPVFASLNVHREALAALTFLHQAEFAERASL